MKKTILKSAILLLAIIALASCQIREEITFNENGNGIYAITIDMSELMDMSMGSEDMGSIEQTDTVFDFSKIVAQRRDSIAKLSKKEQEVYNALKLMSVSMRTDTIAKKMEMAVQYNFKDVSDVKAFAEMLNDVQLRELNVVEDFIGNNTV
ncbi:hypothetical protein [Leptobacterium sp. I13]|uniref:hypothetical protein n=1 Tax=Leptobacterium meishanense TaxID=3128904 RepID=UPI0030EB93C0